MHFSQLLSIAFSCIACSVPIIAREHSAPEDGHFIESILEHKAVIQDIITKQTTNNTCIDSSQFKTLLEKFGSQPRAESSCDGCEEFIDIVNIALVECNLTYHSPEVRPVVIEACESIVNASGKKGHIMCPGLMDNMGPHVEYVLRATKLSGRDFCLKSQICMPDELPTPDTRNDHPWHGVPGIPFPKDGWSFLQSNRPKRRSSKSILRIAQFTDIHVDLDYIQGTAKDCGLSVCCRKDFPGKDNSSRMYGDKGCNIPPRTVNSFLDFVKNMTPKVDFVIYTGDNCRGSMWEETQGIQLNQTQWLAKTFEERLSPMRVFPVIGNHEAYPTNLYYIKRPEIKELNEKWADWWKNVAGFDQQSIKHIKYAGYYTELAKPGLRVLGYNSNYGYTMNFYNLLNKDGKDFKDMVDFMRSTLAAARQSKEKVLMVGHHPTGGSENFIWYANMLTELCVEYSDIIVLHVFGHTHSDRYILMLDPKTNRAKGVQFVASSLTTGRNPSFRVYDLDSSTFQLQDYHNYYLNIEKTQVDGPSKPPIELLYSASKEYNMNRTTPEDWQNLAYRMTNDDKVFNKYFRNMYTRNGPTTCDGQCKKNKLCDIFYSVLDKNYQCTKDSILPTRPPTQSSTTNSATVPTIIFMVLMCSQFMN